MATRGTKRAKALKKRFDKIEAQVKRAHEQGKVTKGTRRFYGKPKKCN